MSDDSDTRSAAQVRKELRFAVGCEIIARQETKLDAISVSGLVTSADHLYGFLSAAALAGAITDDELIGLATWNNSPNTDLPDFTT